MAEEKKTVVIPAAAPKTREHRYDFTDVQLETLMPVLKEYQAVQNQINFFLDHVRREAKLPPVVTGKYGLEIEPQTGTPYLLGRVADTEKGGK